MGQVLQEARGQSGEILPTGEHAVSGPHQRTAERAGPEQLLPQQCRAGLLTAPVCVHVELNFCQYLVNILFLKVAFTVHTFYPPPPLPACITFIYCILPLGTVERVSPFWKKK